MSESTSHDGRVGLSLLDAARELSVSEKTLRRRIKAGEVEAEKIALDGGGLEWRVYLDSVPVTVATVPEVVPDNSGQIEVEKDRAGSETDNLTDVPESNLTVPDISETRDGTVPEVVPDTAQSTLEAHLLEENRFLRAQLEAAEQERRQRAEEHARQLAEVTAALREALKSRPKALTEATAGAAHNSVEPDQSTLEVAPNAELVQQVETLQSNLEAQRQEIQWMAEQMKTPTPPPQTKKGFFARWFGSD